MRESTAAARYNPAFDAIPARRAACPAPVRTIPYPMNQPRSPRPSRPRHANPGKPSPAAARLSALHLPPDSLGFALDGAAQALVAVAHGSALPAALAAVQAALPVAARGLSRGAIQDIAYRAMRRLGTTDWLIATLVGKAPPEHVCALLACALALLADDEADAAYAPFTVVDQAVTALGARREFGFAKGLVNAVLRRFLRERTALAAQWRTVRSARWNYRDWWIDAVERAWPNDWQAILAAGDTPGPLTLRVNVRQTSVAAYLATLKEQDIDAWAVGRHAVRLATALPVDRIPGFADGMVSVQDAGAQLAAESLGVQDGMRVLDACAAPGGKTGHLLELADVTVVALESDASRATRIGENLARLKLAAEVRVGDAGDPAAWHDGQAFDRILADVPCSASGIVRRHPDIRWLRRETDVAALVAEQRRIVLALWPLLKPGGELLYVTCSIFPEEGELQARWFEAAVQDAVRLGAPGQLLPRAAAGRLPDDAGHDAAARPADHDGFFYARFQKR